MESANHKDRLIRELSRLLENAPSVRRAGPASEIFRKWRDDCLAVLCDAPGDHATAFRNVNFRADPNIMRVATKKAPKVVHGETEFLLPTSQAENRLFQRAMIEAARILRAAKAAVE